MLKMSGFLLKFKLIRDAQCEGKTNKLRRKNCIVFHLETKSRKGSGLRNILDAGHLPKPP